MQKKKIARRAVLAGAAGLSLVFVHRADAARQVFKYANNLPLAHPVNVRAREAAARIAKETDGRVSIRIFPNSMLGGDTQMLSQVRSGAIQFFTLSGLILATLVPVASINGIGFAFRQYDQVWAAMDGPLGAHVRAAIGKAGLVAMDKMWDNGYRQITASTHPIAMPADLHGFRIRVPVGPLWISMFRALGAAPTAINFHEVYSALQTHIVDGEENPLAVIATANLYEVQKYCSLTDHMWDGFWMLANPAAWGRISAVDRSVVAAAWNDAALAERGDVAKLNATLEDELEAKGLKFNRPDPDAFRAALRQAGFYAAWRAKYGSEVWGLLEKSAGRLA